ncbi:MAG: shikimate kinase, partial [Pseudomonadota bacterium]
MIRLQLIGHRGCGKSSLLRRLESYFPDSSIHFLSLDTLIEKKYKKKISVIFASEGEEGFREKEKATLSEVHKKFSGQSVVLDRGAGCLAPIESPWEALWVRRSVDLSQYQFLNRPSLDGGLKMSPERFESRQKFYNEQASNQYLMTVGWSQPNRYDKKFFQAYFGQATHFENS